MIYKCFVCLHRLVQKQWLQRWKCLSIRHLKFWPKECRRQFIAIRNSELFSIELTNQRLTVTRIVSTSKKIILFSE